MIEFEYAMTYVLDVAGPIESRDGSSPDPRRQFWEMRSATLKGLRIDATSAAQGIDWFTPYPRGYGRPHVRLPFLTHDGAVILLEYTGVVEASEAFVKAVAGDTSTEWQDQYMRMSLVFETSSPQYNWLMESVFIARGRLLGSKRIEYEVYRVK